MSRLLGYYELFIESKRRGTKVDKSKRKPTIKWVGFNWWRWRESIYSGLVCVKVVLTALNSTYWNDLVFR